MRTRGESMRLTLWNKSGKVMHERGGMYAHVCPSMKSTSDDLEGLHHDVDLTGRDQDLFCRLKASHEWLSM